jgi:hypothetical protein
MSANELLISVGLSAVGAAVIGGLAALLVSVQYPEVMSRPTPQVSETAINAHDERNPAIMALDDDDHDHDDDDHGWGHHGSAPQGPKRGSDSNPAGKVPQSAPGQTRDRIQQRNADQVERDAMNNRRGLDGMNPQSGTRYRQRGIESGPSDTSAAPSAGLDGPGPALVGPPVGLPLPPIATIPVPSIAPPPDNSVTPPDAAVPRVAGEAIADIAGTTPTAVERQLPESFRVGYSSALRSADLPELAATALPGAAGLALLVASGGLIGYRQARAGYALPASGAARFVR